MMRMDKLVRQCDMEVMKMAMLKHEETFRQQRQLMSDLTMAELRSGRRRQPRRSKQPRRALNLQLPADEYIVSADADDGDNVDTAELDLTLAVGGGSGGRTTSRKYNNAAADGSSPFASDCSGSTGGLSSPSSAEYSEGAAMFLHALPPMPPPPCQRAMAFDLGMGEAMKQQQSPWLVQCQYLSLRMT
ncbi:hypothetical protein E2562_002392 [Oryza meyeriana var. granulata]|uniref:Uncharacterized protein n=1 Tax=Oryza meyeriana var. granulata TaxID=110450 RepID=A0A6G1BI15_9ORYZ|nr:hypothetical protein E2562_002392 [Oryza meyeriana var. granulata]